MMNVNMNDLTQGLKLMGIGMGGIFVSLFIIYMVSVALLKIFPVEKEK